MATIVFSKPASFAIAALREVLTKHLPLYRWQCGEADTGAAKQLGSFADAPLIVGRSDATVIFVETRPFQGTQAAPAPPHAWRLEVGRPTTELTAIGDRVLLLVCGIAMIDADASFVQLRDGGNWLDRDELSRATRLVLAGEPLAVCDGLGRPPSAFAAAPVSGGVSLAKASDRTRPDADLPALIVLADRALPIDGSALERMARDVDPDGGWRLEERRDQPVLLGRGTVLGLLDMPMPLPTACWEGNWARSHWFAGDRDVVARHLRHVTVKATLDTRRADWTTIRQVAKIAQLAACWIAREPGALAIINLAVGTTFEASRGRQFLNHLGRDQLSVALWTWTQVHSMADGDVSLSTSGLLPFTGHELELWHAPLPYAEAGELTGDLIRYLLDSGPVIGHNDTAGRTAGDKSIRCFLGTSRAERPDATEPVPALFLEVDAPAVIAPRPDLPAPAGDADAQARALLDATMGRAIDAEGATRLGGVLRTIRERQAVGDVTSAATLTSVVALTKPVGFPATILAEMLERNFAAFVWDCGQIGNLRTPRLITGTAGTRIVTVHVDGRVASLPDAIPAPPHRVQLRVSIETAGDVALARALALVVCACLVIQQDERAHLQLSADGNWLNHHDAVTGVVLPRHYPDIGDFDRTVGTPPARLNARARRLDGAAPPSDDGFEFGYLALTCPVTPPRQTPPFARPAPPPAAAPPLRRVGGFGRKGL